jgi:hypothetical protein
LRVDGVREVRESIQFTVRHDARTVKMAFSTVRATLYMTATTAAVSRRCVP